MLQRVISKIMPKYNSSTNGEIIMLHNNGSLNTLAIMNIKSLVSYLIRLSVLIQIKYKMVNNYSYCRQSLILVVKNGRLSKMVLALSSKIVVIQFMLWMLMLHVLLMKIEYSYGVDGGIIIKLKHG